MKYNFRDIVIDSRTGLNPRKNFKLGRGNNYYITIKDIHEGKVIISDKTDRIEDKAIEIIKKRSRIKNGDILFTSIGRIGDTAIVKDKDDTWDVNESVFVFTVNERIITQEYFCLLFETKSVQSYLKMNISGSTFKSVKMNQLEKMIFELPTLEDQKFITETILKSKRIIEVRRKQIFELDYLIKSRFVEMFGDPIYNSKLLPVIELGKACDMKAGKFKKAENIRNDFEENFYPCFGGNGIRGYVEDYTHEGSIPIIGRQGALCGNVQFATGKFYATEHAIVTQTKIGWNSLWLYIMLHEMDLNRFASGAAQPGLNVSTLVTLEVINPEVELQNEYAEFVQSAYKLKFKIQKSLEESQILFNSLMQEYFE